MGGLQALQSGEDRSPRSAFARAGYFTRRSQLRPTKNPVTTTASVTTDPKRMVAVAIAAVISAMLFVPR